MSDDDDSCLGSTGQLRRDNRVIYVRHHAALEVAAPSRPCRRHPPRQQPGLRREAPRPGQRRAGTASGQRHHRVDVRVPEPREQARSNTAALASFFHGCCFRPPLLLRRATLRRRDGERKRR
jgi:hypothetical protein